MLREITKQLGPRLRPGDVHDYPLSVWHKIAEDGGVLLDDFSRVIGHNPALLNPLKGRIKPRRRLGTVA